MLRRFASVLLAVFAVGCGGTSSSSNTGYADAEAGRADGLRDGAARDAPRDETVADDVSAGSECTPEYDCLEPNDPECPPEYGEREGTACTLDPSEMCCYHGFPADICVCENGLWACYPHRDCF